jgi:hypothetical protein
MEIEEAETGLSINIHQRHRFSFIDHLSSLIETQLNHTAASYIVLTHTTPCYRSKYVCCFALLRLMAS